MQTKWIKLLFFVLISIGLLSCVDTSVQNIQDTYDFRSEVKFVNLVEGVGAVKVYVDGKDLGQIAFAGESASYLNLPSGARKLVLEHNAGRDTFSLILETERKMRVFLLGDATGRSFVKVDERYIWQTKDSKEGAHLFPADTAQIKLFHGYKGGNDVTAVRIRVATKDTIVALPTPLSYGKATTYLKLPAGLPYTFTVLGTSITDSLTSVTFTPASRSRYTGILYNEGGWKGKILTDD